MCFVILLSVFLFGCSQRPRETPITQDPPRVEIPARRANEKTKRPPVQNIFFGVAVDTLTPAQLGALTRLNNWHKENPVRLICAGYADTVGTLEDNSALSLRRAVAVARHVPCRVEAHGETTDHGKSDAANRRTTIKVEVKN